MSSSGLQCADDVNNNLKDGNALKSLEKHVSVSDGLRLLYYKNIQHLHINAQLPNLYLCTHIYIKY